MRLKHLVAFACGFFLLLGGVTPEVSAQDRDCADFDTQQEAQAYFESKGGSRSFNADLLDEDRDGLACELLPRGRAVPQPQAPSPQSTDQRNGVPRWMLAGGAIGAGAIGYRALKRSRSSQKVAVPAGVLHPVRTSNDQAIRRTAELRSMPYKDYLQTPEWRAKRAEMLERAGRRCQICNRGGRLEVHHRTYERRGSELYDDLFVLCAECHDQFHRQGKIR